MEVSSGEPEIRKPNTHPAEAVSGQDFAIAGSEAVAESEKERKVLGFMYAVPFSHHPCIAQGTVTTSTYVHPAIRKSGVGSAIVTLMLHVLHHGTSGGSFSLALAPNVEVAWSEWETMKLRKVKMVIRQSVVDREGLGKGKERFYEKFGFRMVGTFPRMAEKWGRALDADTWVLNFVDEEQQDKGGERVV